MQNQSFHFISQLIIIQRNLEFAYKLEKWLTYSMLQKKGGRKESDTKVTRMKYNEKLLRKVNEYEYLHEKILQISENQRKILNGLVTIREVCETIKKTKTEKSSSRLSASLL